MLRVALVCLVPGAGGVEHHVASLAAELGKVADVVVITVEGGWLAREALARGVPVATVPTCKGNFDPRTLAALRLALRRFGPDVVHSHLGRSDWYAWLATAGMPVLLASTEHGISSARPELYGARVSRIVHRLAHRRRLRRTDAVVAVSDYTARALVDRHAVLRLWPPLVVMPAVDVASLRRARHDDVMPDGTLRLACLSRLSHEKGVDLLVRAVALAAMQGAHVRATIAGDGPERDTLELLAAELRVLDRVHFIGRVDDIVPVLREADALVIPSRSENLPLAALEAIAAGVPVVATDVGGVGEIVRPGITGWLVPPEDAGELAAVLCTLGDGIALRTVRSRCAEEGTSFRASTMAMGVLRAYDVGSAH